MKRSGVEVGRSRNNRLRRRSPFAQQQTAGNGVVTNRAYDANTGLVATIQAGPSNTVANFSYAFNNIGTLTSRTDTVLSLTENFTYDTLNRLTQYAIVGGSTKTVGFNAVGNLTSKSDVGTYAYPTAGSSGMAKCVSRSNYNGERHWRGGPLESQQRVPA